MPHYSARSLAALALLLITACGPAGSADRDGSDGHGDDLAAQSEARRIVSLIPTVTEILFQLGAGDRLVGRTRWGVDPAEARAIPDVGDGVRPSLEAVLARKPDLVILYDGETNRESRARLRRLGVPTLALRHDTLDDLRLNILRLGDVVGCPAGGKALADRITRELSAVARATEGRPRVQVYYDAWADPPMTIGGGSFIDSLLTLAGGTNVFGDLDGPAPRVSLEAIIGRNPERILVAVPREALGRRPDLAARHGWHRIPAVAAGRISTLDRDVVSRLGPRVAEAAWSIAEALHADFPTPAGTPEPDAVRAVCPP